MHWRNSNFQIAYFLAGKCHTPDGAYRMLCELREERVEARDANKKRKKGSETFEALRAQCLQEIDFIERCIAVVQPLRKYKDLPDPEAHQASQREEWKLELMDRVENFALSGSNIPYDHIDTMRAHPDWSTTIAPYVVKVSQMARAGDLSFANATPKFLQKLETLLIEEKRNEDRLQHGTQGLEGQADQLQERRQRASIAAV